MGLASARPLQTAFKSVPDQFVTRITYSSKLIGIMCRISGSPFGPAQALCKMVYNQFVTHLPPSCNTNYFGYKSTYFISASPHWHPQGR
ncbi:hypothetical protein DVQ84_15310 [Yersinia enterocolitica]|nr:hypothetical protein [Yersinia enterocolitica]EKN6071019.1 hypothetical protein [Yersinia enterocolitica]EKN6186782.1 hypothetical protein [Yersinia enterocolitica]EKN6190824.1 hypothetical protein [Yersinia enterocolitica]EKN6219450.1 hypothetical protein [Yersinia enterocolitica]